MCVSFSQETTTSTPTIMKRIFNKLNVTSSGMGVGGGGGGSISGSSIVGGASSGHHHSHHHHHHHHHSSEDRSDILTNTNTSFTSLNDIESLKLKQQLWSKNRIILISIAVVIVVIIVLITLLAFEPWKWPINLSLSLFLIFSLPLNQQHFYSPI